MRTADPSPPPDDRSATPPGNEAQWRILAATMLDLSGLRDRQALEERLLRGLADERLSAAIRAMLNVSMCGFPVHGIFQVWEQIMKQEGLSKSHLFTTEKKPPRCEDYVRSRLVVSTAT